MNLPRVVFSLLAVGLLLPACTGGLALRGAPTLYAQSLDSASGSCHTWPTLCAHIAGEETVVPGVATRSAEQAVSLYAAAKLLTEHERELVEKALTKCATEAQEQVFLRHTGGKRPTPAECREEKAFGGRFRTRAMFLGEEAHKLAFECITAELSGLRPNGFSIEPRYRSNPQTGQLELLTSVQEEALLADGCYEDLRGTIKPDIVLHAGDPLHPQAIYDLKFPCVDSDRAFWCKYSSGPYKGLAQDKVYFDLLGIVPRKVLPWLGAVP